MRDVVHKVDAETAIDQVKTLQQALDDSVASPRETMWLLGVFALLALFITAAGLTGVMALAVTQRTREIGIRIALGARSQQVVWSIARGVAGLVGVGTSIGLLLSMLAMLALRTSSGDVGIGNIAMFRPTIDPVALLAIAAVTAIVGVAAALVPGRRAARLDPLTALRHE